MIEETGNGDGKWGPVKHTLRILQHIAVIVDDYFSQLSYIYIYKYIYTYIYVYIYIYFFNYAYVFFLSFLFFSFFRSRFVFWYFLNLGFRTGRRTGRASRSQYPCSGYPLKVVVFSILHTYIYIYNVSFFFVYRILYEYYFVLYFHSIYIMCI